MKWRNRTSINAANHYQSTEKSLLCRLFFDVAEAEGKDGQKRKFEDLSGGRGWIFAHRLYRWRKVWGWETAGGDGLKG